MVGKKAAAYKGKQYRNYWCSRATKSQSLCATYNSHRNCISRVIQEWPGYTEQSFSLKKGIGINGTD